MRQKIWKAEGYCKIDKQKTNCKLSIIDIK
jgi:hypothetical protein